METACFSYKGKDLINLYFGANVWRFSRIAEIALEDMRYP